MTAEGIAVLAGAAAAGAAVLAAAWRGVRAVARVVGRVDEVVDDWQGTPSRPGVEARPGVLERLAGIEARVTRIEHEMKPNGGASLRDAVNRVDRRTARIAPDPEE
ncbi:hypothetical protein RM780_07875 [Streptomyces sp. DSM 44917]|uniref:Uncharacterized protein n=1 Tax=Streptomyces boetiae TaxID=3075541 RepID=A0ABU2L5P2_9ACTN|nr:hypothetical protein [Streptomyces sp. DSM 44917]MDT0306880.1 hypothetical protein [Streptomyces sp. DSM 44917]